MRRLEIRKKEGYYEHVFINGDQENCVVDPKIHVYLANKSLSVNYGDNDVIENYTLNEISYYDDTASGSEQQFNSFEELITTVTFGGYKGFQEKSGLSEPIVSEQNSSTENLNAGNSHTFTGLGHLTKNSDILLTLFTDQATTILLQFSHDNINWDSTITKNGSAGFNEFTTAVKGLRYFRVIVTTDSLDTTFFRLQTEFGTYRQGNLSVNATIAQDADAIVARTISEDITLAENKFTGYRLISKLGKNIDIDTGTTPEDVTDQGGVYAGFPVSDSETLALSSTDASDTGSVFVIGLGNDWEIQTELIQLDGTNTVNSTQLFRRVHSSFYNDGTPDGFNAGNIDITHSTTTVNFFIRILAQRSQSNCCVYTIPAGFTGYITRIYGQLRRGNNGTADGALWIRTFEDSPRLRQPFTIDNESSLDRKLGRFALAEKTDFSARINIVNNNNTDIVFGIDIRLVVN